MTSCRTLPEEQRGQKSYYCGYCRGKGENEAMERVIHRAANKYSGNVLPTLKRRGETENSPQNVEVVLGEKRPENN